MKKQFGRSMIEMLGVLALVGILSIGGVAMYRRAVNNHHANSILDDANRYAFAITERGSFPANDNITNVNFEKTSPYEMVAFVGEKSGQYGILVGKLPKGVCEPLVDKANIDYKVRVMPAESFTYIDEIADTGLVYDSFNKDICINDSNDVVLFFGDTSGQCNKPKEGEDYTPCLSNAECCGGYFCAYVNATDCYDKGQGECRLASSVEYQTETMSDGHTWTFGKEKMNWWSTQNWCAALGLRTVSRSDIGCASVGSEYCTSSSILQSIIQKKHTWGLWTGSGDYVWLENEDSCRAYLVSISTGNLYGAQHHGNSWHHAFCQ